MRTIKGQVILPANAPAVDAGLIVVEVRDVSMADAPSVLVAEERLSHVALRPGGRIEFKLIVPEVGPGRMLSLRAHASLDGSGRVKSGDLLTTASHPVPSTGPLLVFDVPVVVI